MNKSNLITIIMILLIIVMGSYILLKKEAPVMPAEETYFSEDVNDWIEPQEEKIIINVSEASAGRSDYGLGYQRFVDFDGSLNSVYLTGAYDGEIFTMTYIKNNNIIMRIYPEMNPNDGIIEGFMMIKRETGLGLVAYLFVDEDWKKASNENLNIIYGEDISSKETFISRKFDFSNNQDGIYLDKIKGDLEWVVNQNPIMGRLFLGEISLDNIKNSNYNSTFIVLT